MLSHIHQLLLQRRCLVTRCLQLLLHCFAAGLAI
jgi:hypothetical protein